MISKYYKAKLKTQEFKESLDKIITKLNNKKVFLIGKKEEINYLYKQFPQMNSLDIITSANSTRDIKKYDYDYILIANENFNDKIEDIEQSKIIKIIQDDIEDERLSYYFLEKHKFPKIIRKLRKELKNKKIILYGAGIFFEVIMKYYDLSGLNIVAIADRRFTVHDKNETFCGYRVSSPEEVLDEKPDYLLISTKLYVKLIYIIYTKIYKNTGIKIKPLIKKSIWSLLKEA